MRAILEVVKNFVASTTMMSWGCGRKVIFRWGDLQLFWIVAHYIDSWPKYPHSPFIGQTERLQPENVLAQNHARAVLTRATDCLPAHCPLERMPLIYRKNMLIRYHYARLFRCTRCFGATVAVPSRWARDTQLNRKSIIIPRDRFEISSRLTIQIHIFMFGAGRHEIYWKLRSEARFGTNTASVCEEGQSPVVRRKFN